MKKTLLVGAASIALAAMPIVGAFATQQTSTAQDTLVAKITTACTFVRYGVEGAQNQPGVTVDPSWDGPGASGTPDATTHTYEATLIPTADVELGTSHFSGYCNSPTGFTVTVATPNLATTGTTPNTIAFSGTAVNATTGEGWTLKKSDNTLIPSSGSTFMTSGSATTSGSPVNETATYTVYTNSDTKAGIYTSNVVYTFTYDDPAI